MGRDVPLTWELPTSSWNLIRISGIARNVSLFVPSKYVTLFVPLQYVTFPLADVAVTRNLFRDPQPNYAAAQYGGDYLSDVTRL